MTMPASRCSRFPPPFQLVVVHAGEDPCLVRAEAPPGLLSPAETAQLAALRVPARRRKWLLGRVAGKRLVRAALLVRAGGIGEPPPPAAISILNEPSGAPFAVLEGEGRLPWQLSLSHRGELGLAALVVDHDAGVRLGADLETIEPRALSFVSDFFTEAEAAAALAAVGREVDLRVARTWSAKEAVLKALGVGLRRDTRDIEIVTPPPSADEVDAAGWRRLAVAWPRSEPLAGPATLLWRDHGAYVVTVALLSGVELAASR